MTLTSLLADAGLTGRGGAAFSTARKVEAAHAHGAHLVVNLGGDVAVSGTLPPEGWSIDTKVSARSPSTCCSP